MCTYLPDLPDLTLKIRGVLLSEEPAIAAVKHQPQDFLQLFSLEKLEQASRSLLGPGLQRI